ncbi:hypothetical protein CKO28_00750 [Rhodovibrio sodomensis]|uniref:SprT-like domain-containing protein n=1 Tax=Rhodovibrio sodomensis TaxID=1088 RepID=A0ABS1D893_9PROT|nr:hypothetical protein [Rhodovibrio sodomensis]MBK1666570.1 hypothetical protein [Rhodovibrio sodomensis]
MHDYDPGWDYRPIRRPASAELDEAEQAVRLHLIPAMDLPDMTLFFVRRGQCRNGAIAKYIAGTASHPVIALDVAAHRAAARSGRDLQVMLRTSLAHELAHAYLESCGIDPDLHCEDEVEEFAADFAHHGRIHLRGLFASHDHLLD